MITVEQVKRKLNMNLADTSQDAYIQNEIELAQNLIIDYCNNPDIVFSSPSGLDNVVMYLVVRELNPETKLRAGKSAENMGASLSFIDDIPKEFKRVLKKYRRLTFL